MLSTPPRLSANTKKRIGDTNRRTLSSENSDSPSISAVFSFNRIVTTAPPVLICALQTSCCLWEGRPGYRTSLTFSCPSRNCATLRAFAHCLSIRRARVLTPRSARKQSKGEAIAPTLLDRKFTRSASSLSRTTRAPPIRSEWPPMYLDVLNMTRSAPMSRGFWLKHDAKVLSTATKTVRPPPHPFRSSLVRFTVSTTLRMSTNSRSGLVGVSTHTILVVSRRRPRKVSVSVMSMYSNSIPFETAFTP
mmetsp:Transcript_297/g.709  ORF Transcript_297/g.709 Transcript_297/m.709 type:complete len:248 (+) Transcript_297:360-1103(+)